MKFHSSKWCDIDMICKFVICLILVSPVHLYPRSRAISSNDRNEDSSGETLNSNRNNVVVAKNIVEKPVFDSNDAVNYRSARYLKFKTIADDERKPNKESTRQFNVPFMAVPSNWIATFEPSNAVLLTNKVPLRIWAIGSVAKFPSFLERIVQRIQSYYSTYKYQDLSRPVAQGIISPQYHQYDPENTATDDNSEITESFETISHDPIDDFTEMNTDTSNMDYFDTTTDMNYIELDDDSTSTETGIEITS